MSLSTGTEPSCSRVTAAVRAGIDRDTADRKSTRLNSSHWE